jgi:hypothetical protein
MSGNRYLDILDADAQRRSDMGTAPTSTNRYAEILDADERAKSARLRSAATLAIDTNPDEIARQRRIASLLGLPPTAADAIPDDLKREARIRSLEKDTAGAPVTQQALGSVPFAQVAHDDAGILTKIEEGVKRGWASFRQSVPATQARSNAETLTRLDEIERRLSSGAAIPESEDPLGVQYMPPEQRAALRADTLRRIGQQAGRIATLETERQALPQADPVVQAAMQAKTFGEFFDAFRQKPLEFIATVGAESLPNMIPGLVAGVAGGVVGGLPLAAAGAGAGSFATEYAASILDALRDSGIDITDQAAVVAATQNPELMQRIGRRAFTKAAAVGAFDGLSVGLGGVTLAPRAMTSTVARQATNIAAQAPAQGVLGAAGEAAGLAASGQELNAGAILSEFFGEFVGAPADVATAAVARFRERGAAAQSAVQNAQAIEALNALSTASKTRERDVQAFQQFVDDAASDGPVTDIYVPAAVLNQMGIAAALAEASPSVREQINEASARGGDIRIPLGEYAANIASSEVAGALLEHIKTDPAGMSLAEAQAFFESDQAAELEGEIAQAAAQRTVEQEARRAADEVKADVKSQLDATKRFGSQANDAYASLVSNFFAVLGARMGVSPREAYAPHKLTVLAEVVKGQGRVYSQTPTFRVESTGSVDGQTDFTLTAEVDGRAVGTLDYSVFNGVPAVQMLSVPEGDRRKGYGRALVQQLQSQFPDSEIDTGMMTDDGAALRAALPTREVADPEVAAQRQRLAEAIAERTALEQRAAALESDAEASRRFIGEVGDRWNALHDEIDTLERALQNARDSRRLILFQDAGPQNEAQRPPPNATFSPAENTITLLQSANLSSFLHESAHYFLETTFKVARDLQARQQAGETLTDGEREILADTDTLLQWFGVESLDAWDALDFEAMRPLHEKFAVGFERYAFEGRAPSLRLQSLFQKFRAWMLNVYRDITRLGAPLTDEVRGVFDRMLASTDEILVAEQVRGMSPMFDSAQAAGMTPEEYTAYQALGLDATNEAIQDLQAKSLRDMQWLERAKGREIARLKREAEAIRKQVRDEVTAEVMAQPVYRAWSFLRAKEGGGKIGRDALVEMYGGDGDRFALYDWKRLIDLRMTADTGLHPDMVVEAVPGEDGTPLYANGDEMVRALVEAERPEDVIARTTEQRMLEQYAEVASPEAMEAAALEAVHNEARARFLVTEANALDKAANVRAEAGTTAEGRRRTVAVIPAAAKDLALRVIARMTIADVRPRQYVEAAARWGREAEKARRADDLAGAAAAKRSQVLNVYLAKAATDARAEVEKAREFMRTVARGSNEKTVERGRDPDIANAARAIVAAYGIRPSMEKSALAYLDVVKRQDPALYDSLAPGVDAAVTNAKPLEELTVEELRGVVEEVRTLWNLSKRSRQAEIDGKLVDVEEIEGELVARMEAIGVPAEMPGAAGALTKGEEARSKLQVAGALLRRVEQWAELKDGKYGGPFLRFVFQPIKAAADRYRTDRMRYRKDFAALVEKVAPSMGRGTIEAPELGYVFGRGHNGVGMAELLHAILHTGNESNKRKLLLGRGWATENADGTLDTQKWDAFVQRMHDRGILRREHYEFAQGVWDLLESTKPLAQATHRTVFGRYFDEVTAKAIDTPFGTFRGGYVPAQADARIVTDASLKATIESENESMAFAFPTTSKGFTKARTEYNRPLVLDLRTLAQHLDKVLLFAHMEPAVRDVNRVLRRSEVSTRLSKIDPAAYESMLVPWLNRSAKQIVETPIPGSGGLSRILSVARNRAGMALMFANLTNTFQQITGFSSAAVRVKPSHLMRATAAYIAAPRATAQLVAESSPYMRDRMSNEIAAINDTMQEILIDPSVYERAQAWTQRHAYFMQAAFDNVMSPIVWTGAYNQAVQQGMTDADAVRFADGTVRQTQGSTLPEDVSRIETGPAYARIFTQFVGYFNMIANTNITALEQVRREVGLRKGAGKALGIVFLGFLIPAWTAEAIALAMRGGPEDEDDDGYLDDWLAAVIGMGTLKGTIAGVPFAGQLAVAGINRWNDNPNDDRVSLSPAISLIESTVGAPVSVYKAMLEDGSKARAVKDVATAMSMLTGLPIFAVARPIGYVTGIMDERIEPTGPLDFARGVVTGAASPESRQ